MNSVDLSNAFYSTRELLISEKLWPEAAGDMPVDYSASKSLTITSMPSSWDLTFSVDFGGSEGIYIDFLLKLWFGNEVVTYSFGTIKTLAEGRNALAAYAALGANFVYYARREIANLFSSVFPCMGVQYSIYSFKWDKFNRDTKIADIADNMERFHGEYEKVYEGEFPVSAMHPNTSLCSYLLEKSKMELAFPLNMASVIVLSKTYVFHPGITSDKYSFLYDGLDRGKDSFLKTYLHEYITQEVSAND